MPTPFDPATRIVQRPSAAPAAAPSSGKLTIHRCPDQHQVGRVFPLRGPDVTIGRDSSNLIAVNDPDVSRNHALLVATSDGHLLRDLKSTNGTTVNGARAEEVLLRTGDVLLIGATALVYERT